MKKVTWFSFVIIALVAFTAAAQTSASQNTSQPAAGLKITGFNFQPKSSSRLELVEVPTNPSVRPTYTAALGAEYGREPTNNSRYYQYEKRTETLRYATLRVKNEGTKAIKSVVWEFTDPHFKGDKEIGHSETKTKLQIAGGQSAVLAQRVPDHRDCGMAAAGGQGAYSMARSCGRTNRKMTSYYPVEAKLKQVVYADGSVWNVQ